MASAALAEKDQGCFWGSCRCAELLDYEREEALSLIRGAAAARSCWITERKMRLLGDLPLRGAAGLEKGICCFWGSCRCAELLDYEREEALSLGELPLRGAAGLQKGRCGF